MKVNIYRDATEQCNKQILIGEFSDLFHSTIFLNAMLNESLDTDTAGRYIVEYDFRGEGEKE